ncbi:QRFP-like peptide receptor [Rhipicephalus sanguineus]|uniref:QRFP-like peptide receptor n=1 Tax=Rhipicephalus sanguineus TaxID=34632 RepID=UPI001893914B|nr:QRFP-like peptide receptor [Rhipicephalus sanguineus]
MNVKKEAKKNDENVSTPSRKRPQSNTAVERRSRLIPFLELVVAHVSILTILAISFERYYAICQPLKAGYTCTKTRALGIITALWLLSTLVTSPMLLVSQYGWVEYYDGSTVPSCGTSFGRPWRRLYIVATMALLFALPFFVLVIVYASIACQLVRQRAIGSTPVPEEAHLQARRQLVFMLVAVVVSFFVCLLPYRMLILWIIVSPAPVEAQVKSFCRFAIRGAATLHEKASQM